MRFHRFTPLLLRGVTAGLIGLAAFALVLLGPAGTPTRAAATAPCGNGGTFTSPDTCSYTSTGSDTFEVPAGVTSVHVVAQGGAGSPSNAPGGGGGTGAQVTADIPVTAGSTLNVEVGLGGGGGGNYGGGVGGGLAGLYNCGGRAAGCAIVVAGGGGGGGYYGNQGASIVNPGRGGDAGSGALLCNSGAAGNNTDALYDTFGGAGGTCAAGGTGGAGGNGGQTGATGSAGTGGKGGNGSYAPAAAGAGGGGAGYYGGGGGGGGWFAGGGWSGGAGGGGGSSFVDSGASNVSMALALSAAKVTISWTAAPAVACPPGTYSATGNEPCTPAPAGSYVATSGATAPTLCPVGTSSLAGATSCSPIQSLSILGGQGTAGAADPNTQWSDDVVAWNPGVYASYIVLTADPGVGAWHFTGNPNPVWDPAYLVSGHPWGQIPGTNTWMNCGPTLHSWQCGAAAGNVIAFRVRFSIPATLTGLNAKLWINSDNAGTYYLNGVQVTDRLVGGGGTGANPVGPSGCASGSAPYCPAGYRPGLNAALQPGLNEMIVIMEDWGGASGFNFRADITGIGNDPIVIVPSDTTPPVITPTVNGTLGNNGWYTSDVNVSWTVTDAQSSITSQTGCGPTTVSTDTASVTFTCTATSAGGTASQSVTVKRDATAPTANAAAAPGPNANGWNNTDVTVTFTGADAMSGVASCADQVVLTTEGAGQSASGTCTDNAGNVSAPATASNINIDKTAPTATATAAPGPNANGWNNTDVTVTFTGADGLSGIASCAALVVLTTEGAGQSASGTCTDNAGNVSALATASNISVDKTKPVVAVTGVTNGATYIVGGVPAAGCSTTDALSDVATAATLSTAGGPLGSVTVTCAGATDKAGNAASAVTATYTVTYNFCGFAQPLLVPVQEFKAGSTIPVKFCLKDASGTVVTTATGTVEAYVNGVLKGTVSFRYSDGQYIANVQAKDGKTDWPVGTLELRVKPNDGTIHSTNDLSTSGVKGGLKLK